MSELYASGVFGLMMMFAIVHRDRLFLTSVHSLLLLFFFFNDTAPTEIYTLSLHDALPICLGARHRGPACARHLLQGKDAQAHARSEEHTSELQSPCNLVCRLLLEKKKNKIIELKISLDLMTISTIILIVPYSLRPFQRRSS